ncbi:MAG: S9 family peptidase [Candidatus Bathyarchaeota archaeon]|nr:S9 family peptidase [Candidatus Bathyarchaeota archaeon]
MSGSAAPRADVRPHEITVHGHTRVDNYFWLRNKTSRDVLGYLEAENQYTKEVMKHTEELQETLYREMVARIQETDQSAPVRYGDYFYYSRTVKGLQYSIYCRKHLSMDAEEQVMIDLNRVYEEGGLEYLRLGVFKVSPDQRLLAYALDTDGGESYTLRVKDLSTGMDLDDVLEGVAYSLEWANDNSTFFYNTHDEAKRSDKLWRHRLGSEQSDDALIFHEEDELFSLGLGKTRDHRYLLLGLGSIETSEVHVLDADEPLSEFRLVEPREKGLRYSIDHRDGLFYLVTNLDDSKNNRVMTVDPREPGKAGWRDMIPHRSEVKVDGLDLFAGHMVVYERENGLKTLRIMDLESDEVHYLKFPEPVYTYGAGSNPNWETKTLRIGYASLTTADSAVDYDLETRDWTVVKRRPVLGGYDPEDYVSERVFATAKDGVKVPMSLVYRRGVKLDGSDPCLLYGYGSYGISVDPGFSSERLSLLDRGFIFVIAHIRGGGEMGREWYEAGKWLRKRNTFTDFIACGEWLVENGYTSRDRLVAVGRSAGGLLMGAVTNLAPGLFHAVVAGVPFVDVVSTMLDTSIPLTVGEFEEWGNPQEKEYYEYLLSYSPYDNVEAKDYPELLVTAGLNDPRVAYWEPAKWVAKLRTLKTDSRRLLLKTFMGAGHFSSSGRYDWLRDTAFEYAFILDVTG